MKCTCHDCGATYSGTGGGHCRECHRTFTSDSAADAHRKGPYTDRYCIDPDNDYTQTGKKVPWRLTAHGWTPHEDRAAGTWTPAP